MLIILAVTGPIFLLIAIGFVSVRTEWVPRVAIPGMGVYVVHCALPALLFSSLARRPFAETLNGTYLLAFALGSVAALLISFSIARLLRGKTLAESAFHGLGASMANSGFIGFALVVELFGSVAVTGVALSMLVDMVVLVPITLALAESAAAEGRGPAMAVSTALKRTTSNPLVIAIALGLLASLLRWNPPEMMMKVLDVLAGSAAPVSLFVIGGTLVGRSIRGRGVDLVQMNLTKLILHPVLVALMVLVLPSFDPVLQTTAVLLACMPMAGIFPLIAQRYGQEGDCATALVTATALAFVSVNGVLLLLSGLGRIPA